MIKQVGAVVIGRNEGRRLKDCLMSLTSDVRKVIYVDSGSTDDSVNTAESLGARVVKLDVTIGFTAARARNAGFKCLQTESPDCDYVQFVDGDCSISPSWIEAAVNTMRQDNRLGVVCGRRRERYPGASIYNRLCDMEWNTPVGEARACGGDALMRVRALLQVGGYNDQVIAGEEPELCVRLRQAGWKVRRIDAEMSLHDAAMTRFWQWWQRHKRCGHAYAEGNAMHGAAPERHFTRQTRSIWFWAFFWPLLLLALAPATRGISLGGLIAYPLLALKIARQRQRQFADPLSHCWLYAGSCVLSKWPQLWGQIRYYFRSWRGRPSTIIEYKSSDPART